MKIYCMNTQSQIAEADNYDIETLKSSTATTGEQAWNNLEKILGFGSIGQTEKNALSHLTFGQRNLFAKTDFGQCYIGISGNPINRRHGHGKVVIDEEIVESSLYTEKVLLTIAKQFWQKMFVIYWGNPENVRAMERKLIDKLKTTIQKQFDNKQFAALGGILNKHPGGGGNLGNKTYAFLYVLIG